MSYIIHFQRRVRREKQVSRVFTIAANQRDWPWEPAEEIVNAEDLDVALVRLVRAGCVIGSIERYNPPVAL